MKQTRRELVSISSQFQRAPLERGASARMVPRSLWETGHGFSLEIDEHEEGLFGADCVDGMRVTFDSDGFKPEKEFWCSFI